MTVTAGSAGILSSTCRRGLVTLSCMFPGIQAVLSEGQLLWQFSHEAEREELDRGMYDNGTAHDSCQKRSLVRCCSAVDISVQKEACINSVSRTHNILHWGASAYALFFFCVCRCLSPSTSMSGTCSHSFIFLFFLYIFIYATCHKPGCCRAQV